MLQHHETCGDIDKMTDRGERWSGEEEDWNEVKKSVGNLDNLNESLRGKMGGYPERATIKLEDLHPRSLSGEDLKQIRKGFIKANPIPYEWQALFGEIERLHKKIKKLKAKVKRLKGE